MSRARFDVCAISYMMSGVAAWSILTATPFTDVLDAMFRDQPENLDLYLMIDS